MRKTAIALAAGILLGVTALSSAAPIVGLTANVLPKGKWMMDTWVVYQSYTKTWEDGPWNGGGWDGAGFPNGGRTFFATVPRVYYGATDWLTIRGWLPYHVRSQDLPGDSNNGTNSGFGDIIIDPKIQIYKSDSGYPRVAILTGVRIPTGETEGIDGDGLLCLSTGSWGVSLGAVASGEVGVMKGHIAAAYWFNGQGTGGRDVKEFGIAWLTLEGDITDDWSALWEFKAYVAEPGVDYYRVYACPGFCFNGEEWTVGFSSMISMWAHGATNYNPYEFDFAPYMRIYYKFF
jgi:hypothetical protein